jgi:hypothetical protein
MALDDCDTLRHYVLSGWLSFRLFSFGKSLCPLPDTMGKVTVKIPGRFARLSDADQQPAALQRIPSASLEQGKGGSGFPFPVIGHCFSCSRAADIGAMTGYAIRSSG